MYWNVQQPFFQFSFILVFLTLSAFTFPNTHQKKHRDQGALDAARFFYTNDATAGNNVV